MDQEMVGLIKEFGALGLLAYVVWWLTRKLNGKFDRLAEALTETAERMRDVAEAAEHNTRNLKTITQNNAVFAQAIDRKFESLAAAITSVGEGVFIRQEEIRDKLDRNYNAMSGMPRQRKKKEPA